MIRIVHIITGLGTGGAEVMLANLLERTDRNRFDSSVIVLSNLAGPVAGRLDAIGVRRIHVGMRTLPGLASTRRLFAGAGSIAPDLVQGWMYHGNLASLVIAQTLSRRVPVLWNIRAANADLRQEKLSTAAVIRLGGLLSSVPDRIVSNSAASARLHERELGFRGDRWTIIPNGFDTAKFAPSEEARFSLREELRVDRDALLIGIVGRWHAVKDHPAFLRAAALLSDRKAVFVMAGCGVDANNCELVAQIRSLGLQSRVKLLGERTDMPRVAAALSIATCASWSESFPGAIGEAMSAGVPAVVTDVGDAGLLVSDTGLVVPPRNPEALAAAWCQLIDAGPERRKLLGASARRRIESRFSLDFVAGQYEALYESVLRKAEKGAERRCAA